MIKTLKINDKVICAYEIGHKGQFKNTLFIKVFIPFCNNNIGQTENFCKDIIEHIENRGIDAMGYLNIDKKKIPQ